MNTLKDSGTILKTIEVRNLFKIVEDINFNFLQVLQLPGFKGLTGADGQSIIGSVGQRGNNWVFAEADIFISTYSNILTAGQISTSFFNTQVLDDLATLLTALNLTSLVNNDIIVLPSRDVIQFKSTSNSFVSTGIRFADGLSLTQNQVITIVNDILGGLNNNDIYGTFKGVAKNYADNALGLNNALNTNSVFDIPVSGSGLGLENDDFIFTTIKEANLSPTASNMFLTGSPKKYHDLVQNTLINKTADYIAGFDDFGALAVMQNSYKNGILIGHKDANDFSTWGRIYRTEQKLRFQSDYDPRVEKVARLDLGKLGTELYSPQDLNLMIKEGQIRLSDYTSGRDWLNSDNTRMVLGNSTLPYISLNTKEYTKVFSKIGANTSILGLVNNDLVASPFQPKTNAIVNDSTKLVSHNLLYGFKIDIDSKIDNLTTRVGTLETAKVYKQQTTHLGSVNANLLRDFGLHVIKRTGTNSHTNFPNNFIQDGHDIVGLMKVNRHEVNDYLVIEQEFVTKNASTNYLLTAKRRGISYNGGSTTTWSTWTYIMDSNNFVYTQGLKMDLSRTSFDTNFELTINHATHSVTQINATTSDDDHHYVMSGLNLDSTGHPISSITKDLKDWFYNKTEIDALLVGAIPIGSVLMWGGQPNTIPNGFSLCDGSNGTIDLRSRFVVGYDPRDIDYNSVGNTGGLKNVVLAKDEMPRHNHNGTTNTAGSHNHNLNIGKHHRSFDGESASDHPYKTNAGIHVDLPTDAAGEHYHLIGYDGGNEPHENRPPYYTICFMQFIGFGVPTIVSPTSTVTTTVGISTSIVAVANGVVTTWSATGLPSGMSINNSSGRISGIPTTPSNSSVTLTATNSNGSSTPYTFNLIVEAVVGSVPVITSGTLTDTVVGTRFSYRITATGDPTTYSATNLPSYFDMDFDTGIISGTVPINNPTGTLRFAINATNGTGTGTTDLTVNITNSAISNAPILFGGGTRRFSIGERVSYYHLNGGGFATQWTAIGLPRNLTINKITGQVTGGALGGRLNTKVLQDVGGTYLVVVTASNSSGSSTANYSIDINDGFLQPF